MENTEIPKKTPKLTNTKCDVGPDENENEDIDDETP
jgi:hypothetical protein